jgi:ParB family chromosome partitioning protein
VTRKRPTNPRGDINDLLGASAQLARAPQPGHTLAVAELRPGAHQPRRVFDEAGLADLARSINEQGVLQPLLVRPVEGGHEIVAGERRWRAAQLAGLNEVPVIIREMTDREAQAAALVENLQRENLNIIDEVDGKLDLIGLALGLSREEARARLIQLIKEEPGDDHTALDALFGPLRETWASFAKNKIRILNWPPAVVEAMRQGLPYTHAAVIVSAPDEQHVRLIALAAEGHSRSELRDEVEKLKATTPKGKAPVHRALQVGKGLGSRRLLARLEPADLKALDRWLDKMPPGVRAILEGESAE